MYSLVLMAALSTGGEAPSFFHKWGCHGCHGCSSSCHGCGGGGYSCGGCWGGGGCHGLFSGWKHRSGCHGGCYSSCYGGGHGCYGASYGCYGGGYGCHGCYGGYAAPMMMAPAGGAPMTPPKGEPVPPPSKSGQLSTPAKLIVQLPESAKLYVDEHLMKTSAAVRTFNTPTLLPGQTYYYILRAEVERDGKTYEETRRVLVRAGETIQAGFPDLERTLAAAAAATTVAEADADQEP